jgi:hypothetical protein
MGALIMRWAVGLAVAGLMMLALLIPAARAGPQSAGDWPSAPAQDGRP